MNDRERFVATMHYQKVDRPVLWEWGAWRETKLRWQREGGFEGDPPEYQECDHREGAGVRFDLFPPFERRVIKDDGRTVTYVNEKGARIYRVPGQKPRELGADQRTDGSW
jgi:hypothetical protein